MQEGAYFIKASPEWQSKFQSSLHQAQAALLRNLAIQTPAKRSILCLDWAQAAVFLATCQHWINTRPTTERLHFLSLIPCEFQVDQLQAIAQQYPEFAALIDQLQAIWPRWQTGFHRLHLAQGQISLTLVFGDYAQLSEISGPIDLIYLNLATPASLTLMHCKQLRRLVTAHSVLIGQCNHPPHRQHLAQAGFILPPPSMDDFWVATTRQHRQSSHATPVEPEAIIIGAGMAGCAMANQLAARGWQVKLIDAQADIASQASGNHIGLCHPTLSRDDNFQARLSRAGFATTQQKLMQLSQQGLRIDFGVDGHLQLAKDQAAATLMQLISTEQPQHHQMVRWLDRQQCLTQLAIDCEFGGWWFPEGMWANPYSICNGYINQYPDFIELQLNTHVNQIRLIDQCWHLYDAEQQLIASSKTLILANATDAIRLIPDAQLPLTASLRSVSKVWRDDLPVNTFSLSGQSYLTPALAGWRCAGASLVDAQHPQQAEQQNIDDLSRLIGAPVMTSKPVETRLCFRPNSSDRLPLAGQIPQRNNILHSVDQLFQIPRQPGLYGLLGLGARGITWHVLIAEMLACQLNQEPLAIERSLVAAIDPARFAVRELRKKAHDSAKECRKPSNRA
ncbi:FAD-dependent 5-carboxymethylaminomethyl-2-thiouridine(34) oxidoreductase MnmC [Deefgea salmonis]|uniref:FAD-dependent 5-carboxymethylaminomethyl-2-thiouridine(34) oxidoreductase MnmC n=1 Tax=Deefgea salmonis TaxID=2875502 RepID=A0ABS8BH90_9NEIS|nr:FAD-dependent 5-carboxymethylaminomethyl-2-thiouridine(34) oxidoreductase MnmC [Deefgea salmonis]MCB5194961.1 FAD-dependent 5-carboxymethylaminomethyl-2-thiouridine(34) oxidoreductase MnmC [Deefgea salmonis]